MVPLGGRADRKQDPQLATESDPRWAISSSIRSAAERPSAAVTCAYVFIVRLIWLWPKTSIHARRHTLREHQRGACVTQVVEALVAQAGGPQQHLQSPRDGDAVKRCADGRAEHEVTFVLHPPSTSAEASLVLPYPLGSKGLRDKRGHRNRPVAGRGLGLDENQHALDPLQGVAHGDGVSLEIDVMPRDSEQLALAQSRADSGDEEGLEPVTGDGVEEALAWDPRDVTEQTFDIQPLPSGTALSTNTYRPRADTTSK